MIKFVLRYVMENCPEELRFFNSFYDKGLIQRLEGIVNSDFARVTYTEAVWGRRCRPWQRPLPYTPPEAVRTQ